MKIITDNDLPQEVRDKITKKNRHKGKTPAQITDKDALDWVKEKMIEETR